jgi:hypothetical protein
MSPNQRIASKTRLGFIGLGYLGSHIARRPVAAGFPVNGSTGISDPFSIKKFG